MWSPYVIPAISALIAFAAFYFSTRAVRTQAASGIHAVDALAYERASGIYEDTIKSLRADIASLRDELAAARAEIKILNDEVAKLKRGEVSS